MENDVTSAAAQVRRLKQVYEQLEAELQQPAMIQRLRQSADNNEWSTLQILGHMVEMIPYWLRHCQTLVAAMGNPPQFGRTLDEPERLEGIARGATKNPDELICLLKQEIAIATETIQSMSPMERDKTGIHIRHGEMTVENTLETFVVSHAEDHLAQVKKALHA